MNKYIWQELKRVLIKKKISVIVILIIIIAFGIKNISGVKPLGVELKQYKTLLNVQKNGRDEDCINLYNFDEIIY